MTPDPTPPQVTIEDLLRLKRAERPPVEFWHHFEQELRAKQLAAIVEKRRWWHALPRATAVLVRFQLPVGAAAALAVAFIAVRSYQDAGSPSAEGVVAQVAVPSINESAIAPAMPAAALVASEPGAMVDQTSVAASIPVKAPAAENVVVAVVPEPQFVSATAVVPVSPVTLTDMIPWAAPAFSQNGQNPVESPSARSIADNLAVAQALEPANEDLMENIRSFEARLLPERHNPAAVAVVQPASSSPRDLRRARVIAAVAMADEASAQDYGDGASRERLTSRLSEDKLYDSARRLGVGGDRFTVKF